MCGIAGIITGAVENNGLKAQIEAMLNALHHRGPDDLGLFLGKQFAFGHTRLSILDLSSNGHQPMVDKSLGIVITYNGEVYNFRELRKELEAVGVRFNSHSDTEVVLKAYIHWGVGAFNKLDGMFAFALYDPRINKILIVRDFAGIKPLYYYQDQTVFAFCSEIKGLKAADILATKIDPQGLSEYLWYGNTISEHTLHSGVKKLLPGRYLEFDLEQNAFEIKSYWKLEDYLSSSMHLTESEAVGAIRSTLEASVERQLVSDVPVGICLSGGIDSSAITAFASRHYSGRLKTFSVDFDFMGKGSELPLARLVANKFNTEHHELHITSGDVVSLVEESIGWHDEPFADAANLPLFLISKRLKELGVKVILQGDGGDELFAGYRRYNTMQHRWFWKLLSPLSPMLTFLPQNACWDRRQRFLDAITQRNPPMMHALVLTVESLRKSPVQLLSSDLQKLLAKTNPFATYEEAYGRYHSIDEVQRMLAMDYEILLQHDFLEKVDKPTMANSVEVRVPFLAKPVVELALGLPSRYKVQRFEKKYLLKKALDGIVPREILYGPKKGFGVPYKTWLINGLRGLLEDSIGGLVDKGILTKQEVRKLIDKHVSSQQDNGFMLWKLLLLGIWINENKLVF